jgi:diguanylate cyclase (GGDEF)-like protein/PAS domain S-box-containing protein
MADDVHPSIARYLDLLMDAICVVDVEGRFLFVSAAGERIFGYAPSEMIGRRMEEFVHPDDRAWTLEAAAEIMAGRSSTYLRNRYLRKDGRTVHVMWTARWSEEDGARIAVARDITELERAESLQAALYAISQAAHTAEDLLALFHEIHQIVAGLLPAKNFYVALLDPDSDTLSFPYFVDQHDAPPAPCRLDAETRTAEVIRSGAPILWVPAAREGSAERPATPSYPGTEPMAWLGVPLETAGEVIGALVVQSYSGELTYTTSDQELLQFVSVQVAHAITRKQAEARLQQLALFDPLTGLPNRVLLHDRIETALARARRDRSRLAVLYIDLDGFKEVNDRFGHAVGDRILPEVGARFVGCVRAGDTVARLGGDEFVVLLSQIALPQHAAAVAEKVRRTLVEPFEHGELRLQLSASIGVAVFPEHGDALQPLLQRADEAMYRAKRNGGDRFELAVAAEGEDRDPAR